MPWPEKQRKAIFLATKRKKGLSAAKRVMHEAGYGTKKKTATKHQPMHKMPGGHMMKGSKHPMKRTKKHG